MGKSREREREGRRRQGEKEESQAGRWRERETQRETEKFTETGAQHGKRKIDEMDLHRESQTQTYRVKDVDKN